MFINKVSPQTARSMSKPIQFIKEVDFSRDLSINASPEGRSPAGSREGRDLDVSIGELVKGFKTPSKATIAIRDDENPSGTSPSHRRQNYSMIITQFQDDGDLFAKKRMDRARTKKVTVFNQTQADQRQKMKMCASLYSQEMESLQNKDTNKRSAELLTT